MKNPLSLALLERVELIFRFAPRYQTFFVLIFLINQTVYAQVELVKDLNLNHDFMDHEYRESVEYNGQFFFATHNELWRSNGLKTGTHLVKHFNQIRSLAVFNGQLYFAADDGNGLELWKSGGASYNTKLVKDINPGSGGSTPSQFTAVGNTLYFVASTAANGTELWKTDGTTTGTMLLRDIINRGGSSNPNHLEEVNGLLVFAANDGVNGYELWRSNGTTAGTHILKDIKPGSRVSSNPAYNTNVNNVVFFIADNGVNGRELWKTDGTEPGTVLVKDIVPGSANTYYDNLINVNGQLFFSANDRTHGEELWKSNGTPEGTLLVKDLTPGRNGSGYQGAFSQSMTNFAAVNGKLYFTAHLSGLYYFWKSDGTNSGTIALLPVERIGITQINAHFLSYGDNVYFVNGGEIGNYMSIAIMRESPTGAITKVTQQMLNDYYATESPLFAKGGNFMFFSARLNSEQGHSLFSTNGTAAGTRQIADVLIVRNQPSEPKQFVKIGSDVYFTTTTTDYSTSSVSLWKTNGTETGTTKLITLNQIAYMQEYNGQLIFSGNQTEGTYYWDIFKTDGTPEGTVPLGLANLGNYPPETLPVDLTVIGQKVFYTTSAVSNGPPMVWTSALWVTTGVSPTKLTENNYARIMATAGNQLFFVAYDSIHGSELWRTDGTVAGTRMVEDINPGKDSSIPDKFTVRNGVAYFVAFTTERGYELYRSNGTSAGTYMIKDLRTNDTDINGSMDFGDLIATTGAVYFSTPEGVWTTNGTSAGTYMLADVVVSSPLVRSNDRIYFATGNYPGGPDPILLWKSDGTPESTGPVTELEYTSFSFHNTFGGPSYATIGDVFYFSFSGSVLWRTDGSACGTYQVEGTNNYPSPIQALGNTLLFGFNDAAVGRELFRLDTESIPDADCATLAASTNGIEVRDEIGSGISSYPNPFNDSFTLSIKGDSNQNYTAEIIDLRGNSVERKSALPFNEDHALGRNLTPGMYILKVREVDRMSTVKIIKR
jgi:ELWxxDGT repeat protein